MNRFEIRTITDDRLSEILERLSGTECYKAGRSLLCFDDYDESKGFCLELTVDKETKAVDLSEFTDTKGISYSITVKQYSALMEAVREILKD